MITSIVVGTSLKLTDRPLFEAITERIVEYEMASVEKMTSVIL
jgi:hypothetical protein